MKDSTQKLNLGNDFKYVRFQNLLIDFLNHKTAAYLKTVLSSQKKKFQEEPVSLLENHP